MSSLNSFSHFLTLFIFDDNSRGVRHFQESSYTQSRIKQKLTWGLWEKVRKIAGRIRIFVHPQEEWRNPRKIRYVLLDAVRGCEYVLVRNQNTTARVFLFVVQLNGCHPRPHSWFGVHATDNPAYCIISRLSTSLYWTIFK